MNNMEIEPAQISWQCKFFSELSNRELYKIVQLRIEVFIVEQNCPYQDCDAQDLKAYHLCAWHGETLVAYTRLFDKNIFYPNAASIGRVLTSPSVRKKKLGKQLMFNSIEEVYRLFGKVPIKIGAQLYLKRFYESFDFVQEGDVFFENGTDNIPMIKNF